MPNPIQAADAVIALESAQRDFRQARAARREAMRAAVQAGAPLRDIARAAECSHEAVRRLAATDGSALLLFSNREYPLTEEQVEMLVYKLAGSAKGAFPKDIELLGAGTDWLHAAGELANVLHETRVAEEAEPLVLSDDWAFALYQVLRLTYTGRPTVLSRLYDDLLERYGRPDQPHVIAELGRKRPRKH